MVTWRTNCSDGFAMLETIILQRRLIKSHCRRALNLNAQSWLQHFNEQWVITQHAMTRKAATTNTDSARMVQKYDTYHHTIWSKGHLHMDKTALFYNARPKRAMILKGELCQGGKEYTDSTTVLFCHTADGSNLSSNCWKV
jgi:hypothetical protein